MKTLFAIFTIPFSLASCCYFGWRAWLRTEEDGTLRPPEARMVSAALTLLALGPLVAAAMACGWIRASFYPWAAALGCVVSIALVIAIIRVEEMEEQRRKVRESKRKGREMIEQARIGGQMIGPPARKRR